MVAQDTAYCCHTLPSKRNFTAGLMFESAQFQFRAPTLPTSSIRFSMISRSGRSISPLIVQFLKINRWPSFLSEGETLIPTHNWTTWQPLCVCVCVFISMRKASPGYMLAKRA